MSLLVALLLGVVSVETGDGGGEIAAAVTESAMVLHTYEARIRLNGKVSTTQVKASDAGQAKKLVQAQFGPSVTVLSVKKVD
jgi:hypothetical protein